MFDSPELLRYQRMSLETFVSAVGIGVEPFTVYEKKGHYFSDDTGFGCDITKIIERLDSKYGVLSMHIDGGRPGYKKYAILLIEDIRNAKRGSSLYHQAQNPILN